MTKRERIHAAICGEPVDQVPRALWRHFPRIDQTAEGLAAAVVEFQRRYDFDLVKVTPTSGYPAEAWGARLEHRDNEEGTRRYLSRPVQATADWHKLPRLDVTQGVLGRELRALELIRAELGPDVPIFQTIFSPLTTAKNLSGDLWLTDLQERPDDLKAGLSRIAEVTADFARACLQAGADGIFFATQLANARTLTEAQYREFGVRYDRMVLDEVVEKAALVLLHVHGFDIFFDLMAEYPVDIINWHDRRTPPSLAEGQVRFRGAVLGGIDEWGTLLKGSPQDVREQMADAVRRTGGRRLIIGAGCVTPITVPEANLRAVAEG